VIRSADNHKLRTIRKLRDRRWREKLDLFAAEGEDLVEAAQRARWPAAFVLLAGEDVEAELLSAVSALGSGTRAIGVYERRWADPGGDLSVWLHAVRDPGNVGTIIRSAHALADGPVVLGPGCADPFSPQAVRASMGAIFARPPARAPLEQLEGHKLALSPRGAQTLREVEIAAPLVLCLGSERAGLPPDLEGGGVRIEARGDSLNVAMAATVALYETAHRMRADA
jgi:TrmH family RNA methyltransferase